MAQDVLKLRKSRLALGAGALFGLAGVVEFATALTAHGSMRTGSLSAGAMFLCVGAMWVAIGAKWKKPSAPSCGSRCDW
jgi:hypothetical protein